MELQKPPVYESKESFGMQGWFQKTWAAMARKSNIVTKTEAYTVMEDIYHVRANATSAIFTVTLPTALGRDGRQVLITKVDSSGNAVTIAANGSDTIEGSATIALAAQWNKALLISNGNNGWERLI